MSIGRITASVDYGSAESGKVVFTAEMSVRPDQALPTERQVVEAVRLMLDCGQMDTDDEIKWRA